MRTWQDNFVLAKVGSGGDDISVNGASTATPAAMTTTSSMASGSLSSRRSKARSRCREGVRQIPDAEEEQGKEQVRMRSKANSGCGLGARQVAGAEEEQCKEEEEEQGEDKDVGGGTL